MRLNLPVTDQEFSIPAGAALVSCTDLQGRIVHANATFVAVSGYSRDELMGRRTTCCATPTCRPRATATCGTPSSGRPWSGVVKNRRKTATTTGCWPSSRRCCGTAAGGLCVSAHGAHTRSGGGRVGAVHPYAGRGPRVAPHPAAGRSGVDARPGGLAAAPSHGPALADQWPAYMVGVGGGAAAWALGGWPA